jgi:hypothetical protein
VTTDDITRPSSGNRRDLFIIIGTMMLVVVASTLLFTATQRGWVDLPTMLGTKNNGELVTPPLPIADLPLRNAAGQPFDYAAEPKRWTLLVPIHGSCDEACEQALYLTRQVDIALGREANRVRRYAVATQYPLPADVQQLLREQHADITVLHADRAALDAYLARLPAGAEVPRFAVVDPYGWLMMYYSARHDGRAVLDDLKFLVKNSHENEEL